MQITSMHAWRLAETWAGPGGVRTGVEIAVAPSRESARMAGGLGRGEGKQMRGTPASDADVAALEAFYRDHLVDAARWATALTGNRHVGEELAQDALIATGARLASLTNPGGYLRRTVVNLCRSWHRSAEREKRRIDLVHRGLPTSVTPAGAEMLDSLAVLPYRQRAAVVLRYWADWDDDQIADALGCRPATVRVLLHRGIAALRIQISEEAE